MTVLSKSYSLQDILDILFCEVLEAPGSRFEKEYLTPGDYIGRHLSDRFRVIINDNGELELTAG